MPDDAPRYPKGWWSDEPKETRYVSREAYEEYMRSGRLEDAQQQLEYVDVINAGRRERGEPEVQLPEGARGNTLYLDPYKLEATTKETPVPLWYDPVENAMTWKPTGIPAYENLNLTWASDVESTIREYQQYRDANIRKELFDNLNFSFLRSQLAQEPGYEIQTDPNDWIPEDHESRMLQARGYMPPPPETPQEEYEHLLSWAEAETAYLNDYEEWLAEYEPTIPTDGKSYTLPIDRLDTETEAPRAEVVYLEEWGDVESLKKETGQWFAWHANSPYMNYAVEPIGAMSENTRGLWGNFTSAIARGARTFLHMLAQGAAMRSEIAMRRTDARLAGKSATEAQVQAVSETLAVPSREALQHSIYKDIEQIEYAAGMAVDFASEWYEDMEEQGPDAPPPSNRWVGIVHEGEPLRVPAEVGHSAMYPDSDIDPEEYIAQRKAEIGDITTNANEMLKIANMALITGDVNEAQRIGEQVYDDWQRIKIEYRGRNPWWRSSWYTPEGEELREQAKQAVIGFMLKEMRFPEDWEAHQIAEYFVNPYEEIGAQIILDPLNWLEFLGFGKLVSTGLGATKRGIKAVVGTAGKAAYKVPGVHYLVAGVARLGDAVTETTIITKAQFYANDFSRVLAGAAEAGMTKDDLKRALIAIANGEPEDLARLGLDPKYTEILVGINKTHPVTGEPLKVAGLIDNIELDDLSKMVDRAFDSVAATKYDELIRSGVDDLVAAEEARKFAQNPKNIIHEAVEIARREYIDLNRLPSGRLNEGLMSVVERWAGRGTLPYKAADIASRAMRFLKGMWVNAVLLTRPAWPVWNYLDTNFRGLITGMKLGDTLEDIIKVFPDGIVPENLRGRVRGFIVGDVDLLARMETGWNPTMAEVFFEGFWGETLWRKAGTAAKKTGDFWGTVKELVSEMGPWRTIADSTPSVIGGVRAISSALEFNAAVRVAASKYLKNVDLLRPIMLENIAQEAARLGVSDVVAEIVTDLTRMSGNKPAQITDLARGVAGGKVMRWSHLLPDEIMGELVGMSPAQQQSLVRSWVEDLQNIIKENGKLAGDDVANTIGDLIKRVDEFEESSLEYLETIGRPGPTTPLNEDPIDGIAKGAHASAQEPVEEAIEALPDYSDLSLEDRFQRRLVDVGEPPGLVWNRRRLLGIGFDQSEIDELIEAGILSRTDEGWFSVSDDFRARWREKLLGEDMPEGIGGAHPELDDPDYVENLQRGMRETKPPVGDVAPGEVPLTQRASFETLPTNYIDEGRQLARTSGRLGNRAEIFLQTFDADGDIVFAHANAHIRNVMNESERLLGGLRQFYLNHFPAPLGATGHVRVVRWNKWNELMARTYRVLREIKEEMLGLPVEELARRWKSGAGIIPRDMVERIGFRLHFEDGALKAFTLDPTLSAAALSDFETYGGLIDELERALLIEGGEEGWGRVAQRIILTPEEQAEMAKLGVKMPSIDDVREQAEEAIGAKLSDDLTQKFDENDELIALTEEELDNIAAATGARPVVLREDETSDLVSRLRGDLNAGNTPFKVGEHPHEWVWRNLDDDERKIFLDAAGYNETLARSKAWQTVAGTADEPIPVIREELDARWQAILGQKIPGHAWSYGGHPILARNPDARGSYESVRTLLLERIDDAERAGKHATAKAYRTMLRHVSQEWRRASWEFGYSLTIPVRDPPTHWLPWGVQTYISGAEEVTAHAEAVRNFLRRWRGHLDELVERGDWTTKKLSKQDASDLVKIADYTSEQQRLMFDSALHGEEFPGFSGVRGYSYEGAVPHANRVLIDYSDTNRFDKFMKSIFPFWMFPSRSIPYWIRTMTEHPMLAGFLAKYMRLTETMAYQQGATTSQGRALPSLRGYLPVGNGRWVNFIAPISARYAVPYGDPYLDDRMDQLTNWQRVSHQMTRYGQLFGFNPGPWITLTMYGTGTLSHNVLPGWSLIPQTELIPPWGWRSFQRRMLDMSGMRVPRITGPDIPWRDWLIEKQLLRQLVDLYESGDMIAQDVTWRRKKAAEIRMAILQREKNDLWNQARQEIEKTELYTSWLGYFTGVYPKLHTDGDVAILKVRDDINRLRNAVNDSVQMMMFYYDQDMEEFYEFYKDQRYNTDDGWLHNLRSSLVWTEVPLTWDDEAAAQAKEMGVGGPLPDEMGRLLNEEEYIRYRREIISKRLEEDIATEEYFATLTSAREQLEGCLNSLAIGATSDEKNTCFTEYAEFRQRMDEDPKFDNVRRQWMVGYKPKELQREYFLNQFMQILRETQPLYNVEDGMTYSEWQADLNLWQTQIDEIAQAMAPAFMLGMWEKMKDAAQPDKQLEDPRKVMDWILEQATADGFDVWDKSNDDIYQAGERWWHEDILDPYFSGMEQVEGSKEKELFARQYLTNRDTSLEAFKNYVVATYGPDQFTEQEIESLYQGRTVRTPEEYLDKKSEERLDTELANMQNRLWDLLLWVPPGNTDELTKELVRLGGRDYEEFLDVWYNTRNPKSFADEGFFRGGVTLIEQAIQNLGYEEPSNETLREWSQAQSDNNKFMNLVAQTLGEDFYDMQAFYYSLSGEERDAFREQAEEAYARIRSYRPLKDQFAAEHPIWAKYYHPDFDPSKVSRGAGRGAGGGAGGTAPAVATPTPADYGPPLRFGMRGAASGRELLRRGLGRGGTTRAAYFPAWFLDIVGEAMAEEMIASQEEGKPISDEGQKFLEGVAERHPEAEEIIRMFVPAVPEEREEIKPSLGY